MRNRTVIAALIVGVVLVGCGSDETETTDASDDDGGTTAATEPADGGAPETTQSDDDGSASGQRRATVTLAGETRTYEDFGQAICDADYLETGVFNVHLINTDGSGETMTLALYPEGDQYELATLALLLPDVSWYASETQVEGSSVDAFAIDGNHAEGTVTFISSSGEGPVPGTFDVSCG